MLHKGYPMATHTIVTIVGSLRKESFSLKIANALAKLARELRWAGVIFVTKSITYVRPCVAENPLCRKK